MTPRRSHRVAWYFAAGCVAVAAGAGWFRQWQDHRHALVIGRDQRDTLALQMLQLLEDDSRVRRPITQKTVLALSRFTEIPELRSAEAYLALGLERFYKDEQHAAAEQAFQEAIRLRTDWSVPQNYLGIVLFTRGDEARAMTHFERAMALDPAWARPYNDLAILNRLKGRFTEALAYIEKAYGVDENNAVTHYNHGVLLDIMANAAVGDPAEADRVARLRQSARAQYETVIRLNPGIPAAHYNLACSYARLGDADQALPHLRRAVQLDAVFVEEIADDPDLDPIRNDPNFRAFWENAAAPVPVP